MEITVNPKQAPLVQDNSKHVVSYVHKSHAVLVEYLPDIKKDMFQVCDLRISSSLLLRSEDPAKNKLTSLLLILGWLPEIILYFPRLATIRV